MRWLTREWQSGALPAGEREARWQTYLEHRDATSIHLPVALHRLAAVDVDGSLTLHQGVPDWWALEDGKALTLSVITGDDGHAPDAGPQRIVLQYVGNLELDGADASQLDDWLGVPGSRLLYDEIEVLPGRRFEQRFLLAPDGELTVRFDNVLLVSAPTDVATRDALVSSRATTPQAAPEAAPEPPLKPFAPPQPFAPRKPEPTAAPAAPAEPAPTAEISDPPEGAPAPVPVHTTDVAPAPATNGKRTLRDTLLSWLPGVRGNRS